ncbi:oxidoreductase [Nitzschia inconspicua]|uniref:Oxidoreductase n=1 Tax=Nitzschia inconspicua TaxID=303405 RepID=A0A9K3KVS4_9STRA|nr:oxidoreductase [Nitzschia inconspicua]
MTSSPIGFVGLGIMGEGMAARLVSEGIAGTEQNPLVIWNRTPSKCHSFRERFNDKHIIIKDTPKEVVETCTVTYSMLSTPEASRSVFEGDTGVLAGVSDGKSIVDCATLAEADMIRMDQAVRDRGGRFLEAPVSGSKGPAAQGTLIFLCAGSQDLFDEIKDHGLNVMGKASHFFNTQVGYGTRAKLVVNSLMGTMLAAFGEALALSESMGLNPTTMLNVIGQGAIQTPMYNLKGPKMIVQDHTPNFPLKHAHKDMTLACDMAKHAGTEYSVMESAERLFRTARNDTELNIADEDFSAIYEIIHKQSTSDVSKKRKHNG